jgi:hypothetical protein
MHSVPIPLPCAISDFTGLSILEYVNFEQEVNSYVLERRAGGGL